MPEVLGIKETTEAVVGVNEVSLLLIKHLKDGAQVTDIMAIVDDIKNNPELLAAILAAKDNISAVPAEMKDCSMLEAVQLSMVQISYLPKIISALK
jgi:hypothetical protein